MYNSSNYSQIDSYKKFHIKLIFYSSFVCLVYFQYGLRQLDLSLLSQLWALNESIQEFRTIIQEQENLSPQSPSPSNSDLNSLASDDEEDDKNGDRNNNKLKSNGNNAANVKNNSSNPKKERDFIEDMHQKLERQIQRMKIAPPAPPKNRNPPPHLPSPSRPV
jgi:hypothetical protein